MYKYFAALVITCLFLTGCGSPTPHLTPLLINAYVTSAASPFVSDLYNCVPSTGIINLSQPESADITIRLGEPEHLTTSAFQVSSEELLIVSHFQTGVDSLSLDQVRSIFLGQVINWNEVGGNDVPIQVWSYSPDEDLQVIFYQSVMDGQPITSLSRLAVSSQDMAKAIGANPGSIGILPSRMVTGPIQNVFSVAKVPVLAITKTPPTGVINELIFCLQQEKH